MLGYRRLQEGETIEEGDLFFDPIHETWKETSLAGTKVMIDDAVYARKLVGNSLLHEIIGLMFYPDWEDPCDKDENVDDMEGFRMLEPGEKPGPDTEFRSHQTGEWMPVYVRKSDYSEKYAWQIPGMEYRTPIEVPESCPSAECCEDDCDTCDEVCELPGYVTDDDQWYRMLDKDELVQKGDQIFVVSEHQWVASGNWMEPTQEQVSHLHYRRPLTPKDLVGRCVRRKECGSKILVVGADETDVVLGPWSDTKFSFEVLKRDADLLPE